MLPITSNQNLALCLLSGTLYACFKAKRANWSREEVGAIAIGAALGGSIGSMIAGVPKVSYYLANTFTENTAMYAVIYVMSSITLPVFCGGTLNFAARKLGDFSDNETIKNLLNVVMTCTSNPLDNAKVGAITLVLRQTLPGICALLLGYRAAIKLGANRNGQGFSGGVFAFTFVKLVNSVIPIFYSD